MSRTYRDVKRAGAAPPRWRQTEGDFRCRQCKRLVGAPPSGGRHRNHCPFCLYSRHVDGRTPGDRASDCGSAMAPVGMATRRNGEYVLVHRCLGCAIERVCRIAADDAFELVLALPYVDVRTVLGDREEVDLTA